MKFFISFLVFILSQNVFALTPYQKTLHQIVSSTEKDSVRLDKLFKASWKNAMETSPEWATYLGYPGQDGKWTDRSEKARLQRNEEKKSTLAAIKKLTKKGLSKEELLSYELFLKDAELEVEWIEFPEHLLPINQMSGMHMDLADILQSAPQGTLADYKTRLERLESYPAALEQTRQLMEEGIQKGITQPRIVLTNVEKQIDDVLKNKIEDSPIYLPFLEMSSSFPSEETKKIQSDAKSLIQNKVYPALNKFKEFFVKTYLPACRESVGFSNLPNGQKWYAFHVKRHTTVSLTPDEIHQLGLREVARIRGEMEKIKDQMKFKGDFKKFNEFMKNDSQFFYKKPEDLMLGFRDIAKRIDPELPKLFGTLPRLTYGVREMPAYKAPSAPTAYYQGGSLETGRAGYFEANTYNLKARPKWQMEALTLHEGVPGHHLQISLAQEIKGLPEFRKNSGPTSFIEGWGLYAESLGEDLGFYKDPASKYGQLTYEIWRAIRLVVDTGVHSKNWSRDQMLQYFKDNSPISEQQIINETDRYIADPGQALAYKIGELKFKELKQKAKEKMGDKFSVREFHDQLLGSGALPMDIIERKMMLWMGR